MRASRRDAGRFWSMRKIAATVSVAVFLTLAGASVSYAMWTATASINASVRTGTVTVDLAASGLNGISFGNDLTPVTGSITVHNSSAASGDITVSLASDYVAADKFAVSIWAVSDASSCAATAGPSSSNGTWQAASATGSVGANASASYCVRTSVPNRASVASATGMIAFSPIITATLKVNNWTDTATEPASIATSRIFAAAPTMVGDIFSHGTQCVLVTDGTDSPTIPPACVATITPANGVQAQGLVAAGSFQLVTPSGLCLQADTDSVLAKPCSGDPTQSFTVTHPAAVVNTP